MLLLPSLVARSDIGLGALSVMSEREAYVDFTVPYYDLVGISILMKKPRVETFLFKFMQVFDGVVWVCLLVAYMTTSILLWAFDKWSPYSYQNNRGNFISYTNGKNRIQLTYLHDLTSMTRTRLDGSKVPPCHT